ncbi:hypothetical protein POPTR_004G021901v4 [Populus trichocarpa]|uniref:Uncharacterized protein n=1 Tax=Populus trichocarpa TaxID=3694 RepID=A0ACC0T2E8_POPTR|nr:hypothetical protein BDE02_04G017100 [Populus trichocarpa]KAI9395724.1 hypothetical protein POPTR_004G021901v4 [Populus trichocarpa]
MTVTLTANIGVKSRRRSTRPAHFLSSSATTLKPTCCHYSSASQSLPPLPASTFKQWRGKPSGGSKGGVLLLLLPTFK